MKMLKILIIATFMLSVIMLGVAAKAWEQGNIKIAPAFKVEERWDSNIFYDPNDEKEDFETILTPSVLGEYTFGYEDQHKIMASYLVDIGLFGEYTDQNYGNHDAKQGLSLDFNDYTLDVNNRFQFTSSRAGTEFEHRTLRKIDSFDTVLGFHFNRLDLDVGYQLYWVDYLSDTLDSIDHYDNSGWVTGYAEIMPKTKALIEFKYTNLKYPDATGRDGNAYRFMGGVKGEITAKLTGIIKGGYKLKQYEDSNNEDFSNFVSEVGLVYDINDRMDFGITYTREPFESTYNNNNYYTGDHVLANLVYNFGGNFRTTIDGQYFFNDYPNIATGETEERRDHEWAVGGKLDYFWKEWVVAGIGYRFHQRESTIDSRDYDQHVISGDVKVKF